MSKHFNIAKMTTATTGTGTITLVSAVAGFITFAASGVPDGETVTYTIEDDDNREVGQGVYSSSGTTLTRATVYNSTNGGSKISLSGTAQVFIDVAAADLNVLMQPVANNAALKALNTTYYTTAYIKESGRERFVVWDATVPIATHQADTLEGIYIPPASGSIGAWRVVHDGKISANWFGTDQTGTADSSAAINAAIDVADYVGIGEVHVPSGTYRCNSPIVPKSQIRLTGAGERTILKQYSSYLFQPVEDWLNGEIAYFRCEMNKAGASGPWDVCLKLRSHKYCSVNNMTFWGYGNNTLQERFPTADSTENCTYNKYRDWYFDECTCIDLAGGYEDYAFEQKSGKIELVENGLLQANVSGWTNDNSAYVSRTWTANTLVLTSLTASNVSKYTHQIITTEIGCEYSYEVVVDSATGTAGVRVGTSADDSTYGGHSGIGTKTGTFVASSTTTYITLRIADTDGVGLNAVFSSASMWKSNYVKNGTFASDVSHWTNGDPVVMNMLYNAGRLRLTNISTDSGYRVAYQEVTGLEIGRKYIFSADYVTEVGGCQIRLGSDSDPSYDISLFITPSGSPQTIAFVTSSTSVWISIVLSGGISDEIVVDNISIAPDDNTVSPSIPLQAAGFTEENPTFFSWVPTNGTFTLTVASPGNGAGSKYIYRGFNTIIGETYTFSVNFSAETGGGGFAGIGSTNLSANYGATSSVGVYTTDFVATTTTAYVFLGLSSGSATGDTATFSSVTVNRTWPEQIKSSVRVFKEDSFRMLTELTVDTHYTLTYSAGTPVATLNNALKADEKAIIRPGAPISTGRKPISNTEFNNIKGNGVYSSGYQSRWWEDATDYTRCRVKLSRDGSRGWMLNPGNSRGTQGGDHATWTGPTMTHETWVDLTAVRALDFGPGSFAITGQAMIADSGWEDGGTIYTLRENGDPRGDFELTGTVAFSTGPARMTGTGTKFLSELTLIGSVKDKIFYNGAVVGITSIDSDTQVTLSASTFGTVAAGKTAYRRNSSDKRGHYLQFGAYGSSHGDVDSPQQGVIIRTLPEYDIIGGKQVSAQPAGIPGYSNAQFVAAESDCNQNNKTYGKLAMHTGDNFLYVALGPLPTDNWVRVADGTTTKTPAY